MTTLPNSYPILLKDIKERIQHAQVRAAFSANRELIILYWKIGHLIAKRQQKEGWGAGVIPQLARDLKNELPEVKGFSARNIGRMIQFNRAYPLIFSNLPQPVAKLSDSDKEQHTNSPQAVAQFPVQEWENLQQLVAQLPWGHNILLIQKVKDINKRHWYMQQTIENGWSRNILALQIDGSAYARQGKAVSNFDKLLPSPQSDLAQQALKDPYIFDFMTIEEPFRERELETGLIHHLEKFLLELGAGFAFVGRQYHLEIGEDDFYIDLLFYHLKLRCYVVVELKRGKFLPEYAGKMNFYLNTVDDLLCHPDDKPSIGLILCQDKNRIVAEYALRGVNKPIGISEYQLTRALPDELKSSLPTIEEIEEELGKTGKGF